MLAYSSLFMCQGRIWEYLREIGDPGHFVSQAVVYVCPVGGIYSVVRCERSPMFLPILHLGLKIDKHQINPWIFLY